LGAPLADSPCVPSGNPKFFPHRTSVVVSFGLVGWALPFANSPPFWAPLSPTRLALPLETPSFFSVGRPSCELAWPCLWGTPSFSPHELCPRLFGFVLLDLEFRARGDVSDKMELPTGSTRRLA